MLIFYDKTSGKIEGTIDGRLHNKDHLKMWIGNKEVVDRLEVYWKPTKWFDKQGNEIPGDLLDSADEFGELLVFAADFEADHEQKELFVDIETGKEKILDYRIDLKTKKLVRSISSSAGFQEAV